MSVVTRNVNYLPQPTTIPNGYAKHVKMPKFPKSVPVSGLPYFSAPLQVSKGEKLATEFYHTFENLKKQEAYQQGIHDLLNFSDHGTAPVFTQTKVSNLAQINASRETFLNDNMMNIDPPPPRNPPVAPTIRQAEPEHNVASINPVTKQIATTSTQTLNDQIAQATSTRSTGIQAKPTMREMDTSTEVDRMVAESTSPPLNQIVQNHYHQSVQNNNYLTQQFHQATNNVHHHLLDYHQVVNNVQNVQNVVNQSLQQQQVNNLLHQQQINNTLNSAMIENNLHLSLESGIQVDAPRVEVGRNAVIQARPEARLAIEDVGYNATDAGRGLAIEDGAYSGVVVEELPPETAVAKRKKGAVASRKTGAVASRKTGAKDALQLTKPSTTMKSRGRPSRKAIESGRKYLLPSDWVPPSDLVVYNG